MTTNRNLTQLRFEDGVSMNEEVKIEPENFDDELALLVELLPITRPNDGRLAGIITLVRSGEIRDATFTARTSQLLYSCALAGWNNHMQETRLKALYIFTKTMLLPEFDVNAAGSQPPEKFLICLFDQIGGESMSDVEQAYLKQILFWLYDKCLTIRPYLRKCIGQGLKNFMLIADRRIAVVLLLEVLLHIIQGFEPPLNQQHVSLLREVLLPLHKVNKTLGGYGIMTAAPQGLQSVAIVDRHMQRVVSTDGQPILAEYHYGLVQCELQFINYKPELALECARYVLDNWPEQRAGVSAKEVLLLHEVDKLIEYLDEDMFSELLPTLMPRLIGCIGGTFAQIAQRALQFWKNKVFVKLSEKHKQDIAPQVIIACYRGHNPHWNATVNRLSATVLETLRSQDQPLFESICNEQVLRLHTRETLRAQSAPAKVKSTPKRRSQFTPVHNGPIVPVGPIVPGNGNKWKGGKDQPPASITGVAVWNKNVKVPLVREPLASSNLSIPEDAEEDADVNIQMSTKGNSTRSSTDTDKDTNANGVDGDDGVTEGKLAQAKEVDEVTTAPSSVKSGLDLALDFIQKHKEEEQQQHTLMNSMADTPTLLPDLKFHHLVFGDILGSGAFSTVKFAKHITRGAPTLNWPQYAIKIVSIEKIQQHGYEISMAREISILRLMNHPGITRLVADFRWRDGVYLVLEYAELGDLHTFITTNGSLDEASTRFVIGEVVAALTSVHAKGFVFADLKPENVVLTKNGHAKLTDFGGARPLTADAKSFVTTGKAAVRELRDGDHAWRSERDSGKVKYIDTDTALGDDEAPMKTGTDAEEDTRVEGTAVYMPPEVAKGAKPTLAADAWALGCLLYQCLTGRPPIWEEGVNETLAAIVRFSDNVEAHDIFKAFEKFPDSAKLLVSALLQPNADTRATLADAAAHEFFNGVDVFNLYTQEAPELVVGAVNPAPADAGWARRQNSMLWQPMPADFTPSICLPGFSLDYHKIPEFDLERSAPFLDSLAKLYE
eukprot:m.161737 g.161737  ORF g.161737 m.161737 type:complete len:1005 (-) comp31252_c0_seq2:28-3042(-)